MKVEFRHPWKLTMLFHSPGIVRTTKDMAIAPNKLLKYSRLSGMAGRETGRKPTTTAAREKKKRIRKYIDERKSTSGERRRGRTSMGKNVGGGLSRWFILAQSKKLKSLFGLVLSGPVVMSRNTLIKNTLYTTNVFFVDRKDRTREAPTNRAAATSRRESVE